MAEENATAGAASTTEDFLARLEAIRSKTQAGAVAQAAAVGGTSTEQVVQTGAMTLTADGKTVENVDPLRKCFEAAATINPMFKHFGSTKALDDPKFYLRETYI